MGILDFLFGKPKSDAPWTPETKPKNFQPIKRTSAVGNEKYTLRLLHVGTQKLQMVKYIKENITDDLKAAKEVVDSAPCDVLLNISEYEAQCHKEAMELLGASVEILSGE